MGTIKSKIATVVMLLLVGSMAVSARPSSEEQRTMDKVRKQLVTLPYYGVFDNLEYKVDGTTVTLYGQVVKPITRDDAAKRVARIEGIDRVVNNIEVLPLSGFDDSIRVRAYRQIFRTGGLYRYAMGANPSVHIIVKNGHITLEGAVSTQLDSRLANTAANSVSGVFSVTNNLRVGSKS
jgi:hyperosmotically inducible protein